MKTTEKTPINENWRQLLFLYRSYKLVQGLRIAFDNTERNYRQDWQKYIDEIGFDPLVLVWGVKDEMKPRWIKSPTGKEGNLWSENYWRHVMKQALKNNRTYVEFLQYIYGFQNEPIIACAILGMIGDPRKFIKTCEELGCKHKGEHKHLQHGLQSLNHYAGLHVNKKTGEAPKFSDYKKGMKRDFNSELRAVLCGNLAPILIQKKSNYRLKYERYRKSIDEKHDWETCVSCQRVYKKSKKKTHKLHCYKRALRRTVKDFMKDLWNYWKNDYAVP